MLNIVPQAQALLTVLLGLMPSRYQRDSLQALLGLFLEAKGRPLPQYCQTQSPSALSRFLNPYRWPTRQMIRVVRQRLVEGILLSPGLGRRPH